MTLPTFTSLVFSEAPMKSKIEQKKFHSYEEKTEKSLGKSASLINDKNHGRALSELGNWLEVFRESDIHSPASLQAIAAIEVLCADSERFAWIAQHEWNGRSPVGLGVLRDVVDRALELVVDPSVAGQKSALRSCSSFSSFQARQ